jgi:hypothetical protein
MRLGLPIPEAGSLERYRANQADQLEILYAPIYDTLTYAQAGQAVLNYFQVPASGTKTLADTNMVLGGQLPAPQAFLCTGISLDLIPLLFPGRVPAAKAGVLASNVNDLYEVMTGAAWLSLVIGTKPQITEGMLGKFVSTWGLKTGVALAAAGEVADSWGIVDYATTEGEPYNVVPFVIPSTQNFGVTINTPTAIGITSASRLQCTLHGYLYRAVQ